MSGGFLFVEENESRTIWWILWVDFNLFINPILGVLRSDTVDSKGGLITIYFTFTLKIDWSWKNAELDLEAHTILMKYLNDCEGKTLKCTIHDLDLYHLPINLETDFIYIRKWVFFYEFIKYTLRKIWELFRISDIDLNGSNI